VVQLLGLFGLEGDGDTFFRNVANHSPSGTVSHCRILESSATPLSHLLLPNPFGEFFVSKHVQADSEAHLTSTGVIFGGKVAGA
jgi:hypothetical protein